MGLDDFEKLKEQAKTADSLDELFDYWEQAHVTEHDSKSTFPAGADDEAFAASFCLDGISSLGSISPDDKVANNMKERKAKVLFIQKESNLNDELSIAGYTHDFWFEKAKNPEDDKKYTRRRYRKRMACVLAQYYGEVWHSNAPVGYMNLNKRGGGSKTSSAKLKNYVSQYREFIWREIELIDPEVMFLCGCYDLFKEVFKEELEASQTLELVDLYHLSYRGFYRKVRGAEWAKGCPVNCIYNCKKKYIPRIGEVL